MAQFELNENTTVADLRKEFNETFGAQIKVYNGRSVADESANLGTLGLSKEGVFICRSSLTVGSFIERMSEEFGLKVKVYTCDECVAVLDGLALESAGKVKKNAVKADMESMLAYNLTNADDNACDDEEDDDDYKDEEDDDDDEDDEEWCENVEYGGVGYFVYDGKAEAAFILSDNKIENLVIPEKIKDEDGQEYIVNGFDIEDLENLKSLALPSTLQFVHGNAFNRDYTSFSLTIAEGSSVMFENGVFICINPYNGICKGLKELTNTKLANIEEEFIVPDGVEVIDYDAFEGCEELRVLNLPKSMKYIFPAFQDCTSLEIVNIAAKASDVKIINENRDEEEEEVFAKGIKINYVVEKHKPQENKLQENKKDFFGLYRSKSKRLISGVCGGIADKFGINVLIIRLIALVALFSWIGLIIYIALCFLIPIED